MKKILLIYGIFLLTFPLLAQDTEETDPGRRDPKAVEKIQNLRIAYISEKLGLTPGQAEKFWPVYREYVQKRAGFRQEFKIAQRNLDPNKPDPQKQQAVLDLGLKVKQNELDLEKDYSGRLLKVINAQQMLNLRKAELDFRSMIINQIQQRRSVQQRKENFRDKNQLLREKKN
jgi:signal recognition particle subunit SEC65